MTCLGSNPRFSGSFFGNTFRPQHAWLVHLFLVINQIKVASWKTVIIKNTSILCKVGSDYLIIVNPCRYNPRACIVVIVLCVWVISRNLEIAINPHSKFQFLFGFLLLKFEPIMYADNTPYPLWAQLLGGVLSLSSMLSIPVYASYYLATCPASSFIEVSAYRTRGFFQLKNAFN